MKKINLITLIILASLTLTSCSEEDSFDFGNEPNVVVSENTQQCCDGNEEILPPPPPPPPTND